MKVNQTRPKKRLFTYVKYKKSIESREALQFLELIRSALNIVFEVFWYTYSPKEIGAINQEKWFLLVFMLYFCANR